MLGTSRRPVDKDERIVHAPVIVLEFIGEYDVPRKVLR